MSVKVSLGGKLLLNENQLEEAKSKINTLTVILKEKDAIIENLNLTISLLQSENTSLKTENADLTSKNLELSRDLEFTNKRIENLKNEILCL